MLTYADAQVVHQKQFFGGTKYGRPEAKYGYEFPFGRQYEHEAFIMLDISLTDLHPRCVFDFLVPVYTASYINGEDVEPIWISAGRKLKNGEMSSHWHGHLEIFDGNHRVIAAKKAGLKYIKAIMPKSHYDFYKENR